MSDLSTTPTPGFRPSEKWSQDRFDLLRVLWPTHASSATIRAMLNALPGPPLSVKDAGFKASAHGIRRPPDFQKGPGPLDEITDAADEDFEPILADFDTVSAWAIERKVPCRDWDDLPLINAHRERGLLPTFARKFPTKGIRG